MDKTHPGCARSQTCLHIYMDDRVHPSYETYSSDGYKEATSSRRDVTTTADG